jgi:hypothetical protein
MSNNQQDASNKENFGLLFDPENGSSRSFETSVVNLFHTIRHQSPEEGIFCDLLFEDVALRPMPTQCY